MDADALVRQARIDLFAAVEADHSDQMYTPLPERLPGLWPGLPAAWLLIRTARQ